MLDMSNALQTGAERVVKANNNMRLIADDLATEAESSGPASRTSTGDAT